MGHVTVTAVEAFTDVDLRDDPADMHTHARFRTKRQSFLRFQAASVNAYLMVTQPHLKRSCMTASAPCTRKRTAVPVGVAPYVLRPCADDRSLVRRRGQQDLSMDRLQWPSVHWERLLEALDVALGDRDRRGEHVPFHHLGARRRCQGPLVTEELTGLRQERRWINRRFQRSFPSLLALPPSAPKAGFASFPPPSKKTPITIRFPSSPPWTK